MLDDDDNFDGNDDISESDDAGDGEAGSLNDSHDVSETELYTDETDSAADAELYTGESEPHTDETELYTDGAESHTDETAIHNDETELYSDDETESRTDDTEQYAGESEPHTDETELYAAEEEQQTAEIDENSQEPADNTGKDSDTTVIENNGYTFEIDNKTGTTTARGEVKAEAASRSGMSSIHPDNYDSSTDDKGHLIAAAEGGPAEEYNVQSQDRGLNRSQYKVMENAESRSVKAGNKVETEKTAYISNKGDKPDAYMVNDKITTPDGKTFSVHASFQNTSGKEQQEWSEITEQYSDIDEYPNPDPLRESMSEEDYAALMEETGNESFSVKDEFDTDNITEVTFDADDDTGADSTESSDDGDKDD